ncbi:NRAMP family divalent metal transporter [Burkholderia gladioli]|uniref:NRAMP family divalent metal transporter n=1 Tax=Burkholderia gladioli TaxID=28095 RepID=UPI000F53AD19|nr:NRAMP family divalent metal transporter [Burkholderia gladioli]
MSTSSQFPPTQADHAVLDEAHLGDIRGALGTIERHDTAPRKGWLARWRTLLAILGPGLIVMVGDNDAGAFGTYTQAGQNYGTTLLWTLMLLIPVLYVNQEMVARLGAVTGVGHARLIFARFGRFWGAFSAIDLFVLNALTIVTEFIGVTFALHYFGLPKVPGVIGAALITIAAVCTGSFRRFERFALVLVAGSLLLVPVLHAVHPPASRMLHDFLVPGWPAHSKLADVMLLVIGIVGTTVAPWQLFFQQSYVVDKRITPAFSRYEKLDFWLGIGLVMIGAVAMISFCAAMYAGKPEFGNFTDAGAVLAALDKYVGSYPATVFAIALLDACVIGAAAVSLATAYAVGDVFGVRHSLHRPVHQAKWFYVAYAGLIALAATVTLVSSDAFLGFLTNAVQALAGVLLPSATVFLLLLCNDRSVLGPWCNGKWLNLFTGAIVWVLVMLSVVLTAATVFPDISGESIVDILAGGSALGVVGFVCTRFYRHSRFPLRAVGAPRWSDEEKRVWRMAPIEQLPAPSMPMESKLWMAVLRGYLVVAVAMIGYEIVRSALN